jgi:acyl-CoA synthetase (NDP forming)
MDGQVTAPAASRAAALDSLFTPRSIAVFGSAAPGKLGSVVVENLMSWNYTGAIYPINRESVPIAGNRGYASLAELPEVPECAMLVVPAEHCPGIIRQCADAGVRAAVVAAAGFAELATDVGAERQREITACARASGMRILGPNTNGFLNATSRVSLGYNAAHGEVIPAGDVSVISHSGALFDGIARRLQLAGAGLAKFVPVGNEADLSMLDVLDYLIDDAATRVIGLVIEGLGDAERFRALARRAWANGTAIVALKIGRSAVGARAALAHSSRLAGGARAFDALLLDCGVAQVHTVEGLAAACAVISARGERTASASSDLVVVTSSGAGGALVADIATERGMRIATPEGEWPEPIAAELRALGTAARIRNPIDLGTLGTWHLLSNVFTSLRGQYDGPTVVYAHNPPRPQMLDELVTALIERREHTSAPVVVLAPGGLRADAEARLIAHRIPVFHDTATCFDALACSEARAATSPADLADPSTLATRPVDAAVEAQLGAGGALSETESAALLRAFGVPIVESRAVTSLDDATAFGERSGFPLVLKALAPGVAHKHAAGFVMTGIASRDELRAAYETMESRVRAGGFAREETPLILQPMIPAGIEIIAGVSWEPGLGHFLVYGLGGVHAELFDEVTLLPIPATSAALHASIAASRVGRLLRATEKQPGGLTAALHAVLDGLQSFAAVYGERIASIDVNPLIASADRLTAVDALIVPR